MDASRARRLDAIDESIFETTTDWPPVVTSKSTFQDAVKSNRLHQSPRKSSEPTTNHADALVYLKKNASRADSATKQAEIEALLNDKRLKTANIVAKTQTAKAKIYEHRNPNIERLVRTIREKSSASAISLSDSLKKEFDTFINHESVQSVEKLAKVVHADEREDKKKSKRQRLGSEKTYF